MSESIDIKLKRAAIMLADELSYPLAAKTMNISSDEFRRQMTVLETQLCLHIFKPRQKKVELTEEGQFLINVFRKSIALHDRNASKDADEMQ